MTANRYYSPEELAHYDELAAAFRVELVFRGTAPWAADQWVSKFRQYCEEFGVETADKYKVGVLEYADSMLRGRFGVSQAVLTRP